MPVKPIALLACVLLLLPLAGCEEQQLPEAPRLVKTMRAAVTELTAHPELTGQVCAHRSISASFRVAGQIVRRFVGTGERVQRGQPLAELDSVILQNSLRAARAELTAARASLVQAGQHDSRVRGLLAQRAVSRESAEAATRQLKAARAQFDAARARLSSAEEQLGYATLLAEEDGVVVERLAESGEVVAAGQTVFKIAADGGRDAVFDVPDALLADFRPGLPMRVCLERLAGVCSRSEVCEVSPEADSVTRTWRVKALLDSPAGMELGATVRGRLEGGRAAIRVPAHALCSVEGGPCVWVVDMTVLAVRPRPVVIASYDQDCVTLAAGLEEGDVVVTAGVQLLRDGQKVRVE